MYYFLILFNVMRIEHYMDMRNINTNYYFYLNFELFVSTFMIICRF